MLWNSVRNKYLFDETNMLKIKHEPFVNKKIKEKKKHEPFIVPGEHTLIIISILIWLLIDIECIYVVYYSI